uniref:Uncharacterized protein LOC102801582 n=1 Tax=Saccoglossus kowalevskii TaxID=10224 RepID=A0ABM0MVC7_SACKO|nr:PREDICTED: uncharacterized protein LOC102801582 [Saccoglossus kowalevskii]
MVARRKHGDSKEVFLFGIMLKEAVAALHRIFLDDKTKISETLSDIKNTSVDYFPAAGVLGTHKKAAVFEMIQEGVQFPSGYFYGTEMDMLEFDNVGRNINMNDSKAYMMIVMLFFARSLVATLLVRPMDYGYSRQPLGEVTLRNLKVVASLLLYIARKTSVPQGSPIMHMPLELKDSVYSDDDMSYLFDKLKKSIDYAEGLIREWGDEYVKRLNAAKFAD